MRIRSQIAALLVALLALIGAGTPALAQDNVAVVENTKDDSSVFKLAFNIHRVMNTEVDIDNAAVAIASCENCQTIAVAISVVLIFSDPDVVTTDNLALALNVECSLCETMALAYQLVLTTDGPVYLAGTVNQQINQLLKQIEEIAASDLSLAEMDAQISALVDQIFALIRAELQTAGKPEGSDEQTASDAEVGSEDPAEATPAPTTEATPAPTEPAEPEPSPTETGSTDTPTTDASPSP